MSTYSTNPAHTGLSGTFYRAETWLDRKGRSAWIIALVVSLVVFWPIGLALLAYMVWANKFACSGPRGTRLMHTPTRGGTGNSAFDAYRNETLRRLEEEQQSFEAFLERLRAARDKAEFDQFMEERAARHEDDPVENDDTTPSRAS